MGKAMRSLASRHFDEVISYGGLPMRRADVFTLCKEENDARTADFFAFGPNTRRVDAAPITIDEARSIIRGAA